MTDIAADKALKGGWGRRFKDTLEILPADGGSLVTVSLLLDVQATQDGRGRVRSDSPPFFLSAAQLRLGSPDRGPLAAQ